ncbi:hypothetical protein LTR08_007838 [Meristemomyces frigidus]|nr:hypothetical protein LTR08_007838 [Meristemomyces frigidus]
MSRIRASHATSPTLTANIRARALAQLPEPLPPSPEELDVSERLDRAVATSLHMLDQAHTQLTIPPSTSLPSSPTSPEPTDCEAAEYWHQGYVIVNATTDVMLSQDLTLYESVTALVTQLEQSALPFPPTVSLPTTPPSPRLLHLNVPIQVKTWLATSQRKISRARARKSASAAQRSSVGRVSRPVAQFDGEQPGPVAAPSSPPAGSARQTCCGEQFAPCRAAVPEHAAAGALMPDQEEFDKRVERCQAKTEALLAECRGFLGQEAEKVTARRVNGRAGSDSGSPGRQLAKWFGETARAESEQAVERIQALLEGEEASGMVDVGMSPATALFGSSWGFTLGGSEEMGLVEGLCDGGDEVLDDDEKVAEEERKEEEGKRGKERTAVLCPKWQPVVSKEMNMSWSCTVQ